MISLINKNIIIPNELREILNVSKQTILRDIEKHEPFLANNSNNYPPWFCWTKQLFGELIIRLFYRKIFIRRI